MGKKSRLKRERRLKSIQEALNLEGKAHKQDVSMNKYTSELEDLFSKYNSEDVYISLIVSELWLPNISSIVKHYFAFGTFLSMGFEKFNKESKLNTYEEFRCFIEKVHATLPEFPMLEDYVPELDWGEVKVLLRGKYYRTFYGGTIERITDFIEGYRLLYASLPNEESRILNPAPLDDLNFALWLQHQILSSTDKPFINNNLDIRPGHIETPEQSFWDQLRKVLITTIPLISSVAQPSSKLILTQGSFCMAKSMLEFGESIMSGAFMPAILTKIGDCFYPISLRNISGEVINYWSRNESVDKKNVIENIAVFIKQRFGRKGTIAGPCYLTTRAKRLPLQLSAILLGNSKAYLICALSLEELKYLPMIESDFADILSGANGDFVFVHEVTGHAYQLNKDYSAQDLELVVVISRISLETQMLPIPPDTKAHILPLADFVTIIDSLKNTKEFEKYWLFIEEQTGCCGPMVGNADFFGAFRDTYGVLIEGAISASVIALDPHWGSNWRYKVLTDFWSSAPDVFPDDTCTAWEISSPDSNGLQQLMSKSEPVLARYIKVGICTVYCIFEFNAQEIDETNGKVLETFTHCIADTLAQQKQIIENENVFHFHRIVISCRANLDCLIEDTESVNLEKLNLPLISSFDVHTNKNTSEVTGKIFVNLSRVWKGLAGQTDASFEEECLKKWLKGISKALNYKLDEDVITQLSQMKLNRPRFAMSTKDKLIDLPDHATPKIPQDNHYKIARREMAILFKETGTEPGRYELEEAKKLIDQVKNAARQIIHERTTTIDQKLLLNFCIEQYDSLITENMRLFSNIDLSLSHDVSYDRSERVAEQHDEFIKNAKNYRYLLESCLSSDSTSGTNFSEEPVVELVAFIDWLLVLYGASDVLHNDIDVGGIDLDHFFVPEVFYSDNRSEKEKEFSLEHANYKLGLGLERSDEVNSLQVNYNNWEGLDQAFISDVKFSFTNFITALVTLSQWQTINGISECFFSYRATPEVIIDALVTKIDNFPLEEAQRIVEFLTLKPESVRKLIGKSIPEGDVPIWEHNKRDSRYSIRPLVPIDKDLYWGAGAVERSYRIWSGSISEGYLPASFNWPNVKNNVDDIKKYLELQLEVRANEVCQRFTPYVINIDFKDRFLHEGFEDVGDFDVLAYWPDENKWLMVECKYNQPPFCLKDARRLRERIFGRGSNRGQISKIERRHIFLSSNIDKIRTLLNWPASVENTEVSIVNAYVSREIYWWMRHPPYEVECEFIRVDALNSWLQQAKGINQ